MNGLILLPVLAIISGQAPETPRRVNISVDTSMLQDGYIVDYEIFGKIVSLTAEPNGKVNAVDKNIQSLERHNSRKFGKENFINNHILSFDIDNETMNSHKVLKIHFKYTILDENGSVVKTSNAVFTSAEKNTTITIRNNDIKKNEKPTFYVGIQADKPVIGMQADKPVNGVNRIKVKK